MNKDELFQARTNPDFLKYLSEAKNKSIKEKNISLMYEILDSMLVLDIEEESVNELYEEILSTSFSNIEKVIQKKEKLQLEGDSFLYLRAVYEYAIEKWTNNDFNGSKELLFLISNLIEDEILIESFNICLIFLSKQIQFDDFYENEVNTLAQNDEKYLYFITNFNFDKKEYIQKNKNILKNEKNNLKHLLEEN